jgi:hypothetical protein
MSDFKIKLRLIIFVLAPFVVTIMAWGWWWLAWMLLLTLIFAEISSSISVIIKVIISGFAIHSLVSIGILMVLPGSVLLGGWFYPIIFWVVCFFLL